MLLIGLEEWMQLLQELDQDREDYHVEEKKLSAIYQFAMAMPLLIVPASNIKEESKKRKRDDGI